MQPPRGVCCFILLISYAVAQGCRGMDARFRRTLDRKAGDVGLFLRIGWEFSYLDGLIVSFVGSVFIGVCRVSYCRRSYALSN